MSSRIKVGIVGLGHMGKLHAKAILNHPKYELKAVYDIDEKKKKLENKFRTNFFTSFKEFLEQDIDLAIISSLTGTHTENAIPLMKRGVHILTEKPIDDTIKQALRMIDAAKKYRVKLMVSHSEFFNLGVKKVKELLRSNTIGEVYSFHIYRNRPLPEKGRIVGSDIILDCMVHDVYNLIFWLEQDVKSVYANQEKISSLTPPFMDWCCGIINFQDVSGTFQASWNYPVFRRLTEIFGDGGVIKLDYGQNLLSLQIDGGGKTVKIRQVGKDNLTRLLDSVVAYVKNDVEFPIDTKKSLYSLKVCAAMEESSRTGKIIYL